MVAWQGEGPKSIQTDLMSFGWMLFHISLDLHQIQSLGNTTKCSSSAIESATLGFPASCISPIARKKTLNISIVYQLTGKKKCFVRKREKNKSWISVDQRLRDRKWMQDICHKPHIIMVLVAFEHNIKHMHVSTSTSFRCKEENTSNIQHQCVNESLPKLRPQKEVQLITSSYYFNRF